MEFHTKYCQKILRKFHWKLWGNCMEFSQRNSTEFLQKLLRLKTFQTTYRSRSSFSDLSFPKFILRFRRTILLYFASCLLSEIIVSSWSIHTFSIPQISPRKDVMKMARVPRIQHIDLYDWTCWTVSKIVSFFREKIQTQFEFLLRIRILSVSTTKRNFVEPDNSAPQEGRQETPLSNIGPTNLSTWLTGSFY